MGEQDVLTDMHLKPKYLCVMASVGVDMRCFCLDTQLDYYRQAYCRLAEKHMCLCSLFLHILIYFVCVGEALCTTTHMQSSILFFQPVCSGIDLRSSGLAPLPAEPPLQPSMSLSLFLFTFFFISFTAFYFVLQIDIEPCIFLFQHLELQIPPPCLSLKSMCSLWQLNMRNRWLCIKQPSSFCSLPC